MHSNGLVWRLDCKAIISAICLIICAQVACTKQRTLLQFFHRPTIGQRRKQMDQRDLPLQQVSSREWEAERCSVESKLIAEDLAPELNECGEQLLIALRMKDEALIGRIVMAVMSKYCDRLTDQALFGSSADELADEVAADVIEERRLAVIKSAPSRLLANDADFLAMASKKSEPRRFTGESLTDFGGL